MAKRQWVIVIDKEFVHGSSQLVARFCYLNEEGALRNPLGDRYEDGAEFADLVVHSYLSDTDGAPTQPRHFYSQPFAVETYRAEIMLKMLRKIDKGMERLRSERGYTADFTEYALRVASVVGARVFYVRNGDKAREVSGSAFRRTDGEGVQYYVQSIISDRRA